ncbi:MAG: efflux RND transporter periplasmic adaptor subunit [Rubrimonas sp.]|uniref:efflux RND transporter periplasmic adaptor subunit n=1 Tax=Rubrimonas sp. TaxID=2036015 RepID=UPI002FDD1BCB
MAGILKQLAIIALLGGAGYGGWVAWSGQTGDAPPQAERARQAPGVVVAPAWLERVERTVSAVGTGRALQSVELATLSEGRVVELGFQGGDPVEAGQVLLRLDDAAERARLQEAQAELDRAQSAFARAEELLGRNQIARTAYESAKADFDSASAVVDRAGKELEDRTLRAPFSGVMGYRLLDLGAVARSNTPIGTLDDLTALDVDFSLPERFYGEVGPGAPVRAASEAFPGEVFEGEVASVARRLDPVSRAFTARARIPNPEKKLPAGAFMRVTLVLDAREGVTAPEEAIVAEGGARYVYVVADERAERRAVTIGGRRDGRAEIVDGLAADELVVTRGVQKVADGRPVRILEIEGAEGPVAAHIAP